MPPEPLYQPLEDCPESPVLQPCVERWAMIRQVVGIHGSDALRPVVVDLGCHTGWFCRQFSRKGWHAIGIDRSADWIATANHQNLWAAEPKPVYVHGDLMTWNLPRADVALALSVAMYLFDDVAAGWGFFDRLSAAARVMFLDFGGMYAGKLPFTEENVVDEFHRNTGYRAARLLGRTQFESRPFYCFARDESDLLGLRRDGSR